MPKKEGSESQGTVKDSTDLAKGWAALDTAEGRIRGMQLPTPRYEGREENIERIRQALRETRKGA